MRVVACCVSCVKPESFPLVTPEALSRLVTPDTTYDRIVYTSPGGVEHRTVHTFRVGDYFTEVRASEVGSMGDPSERRMVALEFHIRPGVSSMWKALVVEVMKAARAIAPGVRAEVVSPNFRADPPNVC